MPYSEWLPARVPPAWKGEWGAKFLGAIGAELDEILDEMKQARKAMFPGYAATGNASGSLEKIAEERQLERGLDETDLYLGARLLDAWSTWKAAGSHRALLSQLKIAGFDYANLYIIQRSGLRSRISGGGVVTFTQGPIWTFDGEPPQAFAQFGLLFTVAQPALTWSSGGGFSAMAAKLNRIAWKWRPAEADFKGTWITGSGAQWGWPTTRTWGSDNWGGTSVHIPPR